jgi:predicted nucleotidyltransferase
MGLLAAKLSSKKRTQEEQTALSELLRDRILKVAKPSKIIRFGSSVDNTENEASDVDVAIIFDSTDELVVQKKEIYTRNLFPDFSVDLLFFTQEELIERGKIGGICSDVLNKGIVIYDKGPKV